MGETREQKYAEAIQLANNTETRNAAARRVIAVADAEQAQLRAEVERLRGVVADYEHRITWDTTCKSCADTYDLSVSQTFRAEAAEARVAQVKALLPTANPELIEAGYPVDSRDVLAALADESGMVVP